MEHVSSFGDLLYHCGRFLNLSTLILFVYCLIFLPLTSEIGFLNTYRYLYNPNEFGEDGNNYAYLKNRYFHALVIFIFVNLFIFTIGFLDWMVFGILLA